MPLNRNGCPTCTCAPPSECSAGGPDVCAAATEVCYPGQVCADGCDPRDPGCCANACAPPGCPSPAPLGCDTDCGPDQAGCVSCVASACDCVDGRWLCSAACGLRTGQRYQPAP